MKNWFATSEFDCHDGTPYPPELVPTRLAALRSVLNPIREHHGAALAVVSGYRTEAYNRKRKGAKRSRHVKGDGADVRPVVYRNGKPAKWGDLSAIEQIEAVRLFYEGILGLIAQGKLTLLGGLGYYPGKWVHIDTRPKPPDGYITKWTGFGIGSEQA